VILTLGDTIGGGQVDGAFRVVASSDVGTTTALDTEIGIRPAVFGPATV